MSVDLTALERALIDRFQHGLPLVERPFAAMAEALGSDEESVLAALRRMAALGVLSRVGAVVGANDGRAGTLAAMAVPPERLEAVAAEVSAMPEVNHNYAREHQFNLWFVANAADRPALDHTLARIRSQTGYDVLDLPLVEAYHIDLGFPVSWR